MKALAGKKFSFFINNIFTPVLLFSWIISPGIFRKNDATALQATDKFAFYPASKNGFQVSVTDKQLRPNRLKQAISGFNAFATGKEEFAPGKRVQLVSFSLSNNGLQDFERK